MQLAGEPTLGLRPRPISYSLHMKLETAMLKPSGEYALLGFNKTGVLTGETTGCDHPNCPPRKTRAERTPPMGFEGYRPGPRRLAFTRYCHDQYCMVYGSLEGGRGTVVSCAIAVQ